MHPFRGKVASAELSSAVFLPQGWEHSGASWSQKGFTGQHWLLVSPFPPSMPFTRLTKPCATVHECSSWLESFAGTENVVSAELGGLGAVSSM